MKNSHPLSDSLKAVGRHVAHDGAAMADSIHRALAQAGLTEGSGGMFDSTRRALADVGLMAPVQAPSHARADDAAHPADTDDGEPLASQPGAMTRHRHRSAHGSRSYLLYEPRQKAERPALIVMLHGCSQTPEDFARGTQMNALAEQHGFLVAYPAQSANANGSKCWNWFRIEDQLRDQGEPALIAGITRDVAARHRVDSRRIFVAGLSAGASMAVILGATYPDLYAAVGAHSGLPYAAAQDMSSAFAAMQGLGGTPGLAGLMEASGLSFPAEPAARRAPVPPTIVFHGDRDHTVVASNGAHIVAQATHGRGLDSVTDSGSSGDHRHSRTVHRQGNRAVVEHWVVHGAGHAWSGGDPRGSFAEATGPDASAEMVRFFLQQPAG